MSASIALQQGHWTLGKSARKVGQRQGIRAQRHPYIYNHMLQDFLLCGWKGERAARNMNMEGSSPGDSSRYKHGHQGHIPLVYIHITQSTWSGYDPKMSHTRDRYSCMSSLPSSLQNVP